MFKSLLIFTDSLRGFNFIENENKPLIFTLTQHLYLWCHDTLMPQFTNLLWKLCWNLKINFYWFYSNLNSLINTIIHTTIFLKFIIFTINALHNARRITIHNIMQVRRFLFHHFPQNIWFQPYFYIFPYVDLYCSHCTQRSFSQRWSAPTRGNEFFVSSKSKDFSYSTANAGAWVDLNCRDEESGYDAWQKMLMGKLLKIAIERQV